MPANETQRAEWNTESQATIWPRRERITSCITPHLLNRLALQPGERVVDIGAGGGLAALGAAEIVGPAGAVTGFDISEPLVRLARQRAVDAHTTNVQFAAGDAQTDEIPDGPFDAAMSQFGVMFFDDPVAAFSNIHAHLRPGGRLVFVCWQGPDRNRWFPAAVLAPYRPSPRLSANGGPPVGPFAFANDSYVADVLTRARFSEVRQLELSVDVALPGDAFFDRETVDAMRIAPDQADRAWRDLQEFGETLRGSDGLFHVTLAPKIVDARTAKMT